VTGAPGAAPRTGTPPFRARAAAIGSVAVAGATFALSVAYTARSLPYVAASLVAGGVAISVVWTAATNRRWRVWSVVLAVLLLAVAVASLVFAPQGLLALAIALAGIAAATGLGVLALRFEVHEVLAATWRPVGPVAHGVVFMNPRSGGGKVAKLHLDDEARMRGIEPVVLGPGDDLRALAEAAVRDGADALGAAGGDGSQAIVAAVAASHGLPFVCIPAGTRNHFALDLGVDRRDPVAALDAFGTAREATIDLADVNGDIFVNNVSLGLYAEIAASEEYRDAKRKTVATKLPDLLGPDAKPSGLCVDAPDGELRNPQVVQVSNNAYTLASLGGFGSRARLDGGALGVVTLTITGAPDISRLVALEVAGHPERFEGFRQWSAPDLRVRGPARVAAAVDGEARTYDAPLCFTCRPAALRVRIAPGASGASPALLRAPVGATSIVGIARVARGRSSGLVAYRLQR